MTDDNTKPMSQNTQLNVVDAFLAAPAKLYGGIADAFDRLAGRPPPRAPGEGPGGPSGGFPIDPRTPTARWRLYSMWLVRTGTDDVPISSGARTAIGRLTLELVAPPGHKIDLPLPPNGRWFRDATPAEIAGYSRSLDVVAAAKSRAFQDEAEASFVFSRSDVALEKERAALRALDLRGPPDSTKAGFSEHLLLVADGKATIVDLEKRRADANRAFEEAHRRSKDAEAFEWGIVDPEVPIIAEPVSSPKPSGSSNPSNIPAFF